MIIASVFQFHIYLICLSPYLIYTILAPQNSIQGHCETLSFRRLPFVTVKIDDCGDRLQLY